MRASHFDGAIETRPPCLKRARPPFTVTLPSGIYRFVAFFFPEPVARKNAIISTQQPAAKYRPPRRKRSVSQLLRAPRVSDRSHPNCVSELRVVLCCTRVDHQCQLDAN